MKDRDAPVTLDSGATITVLPKETVPSEWLTGNIIEGKGFIADHSLNIEEARLSLLVEGIPMTTLGGVVPSKAVDGIGVLSYKSINKTGDITFPKLLEKVLQRTDDDRLYLQYEDPTQEELQGVVQDSLDGDEVEMVEEDDKENLGLRKEGFLAQEEGSKDEESEKDSVQPIVDNCVRVTETVNNNVSHGTNTQMVVTSETSGDCDATEETVNYTTGDHEAIEESAREAPGGNDVGDCDPKTLEITSPKYSEDNERLREDSLTDEGIKTMTELGNNKLQGYSWKSGLIIRERLDDLGRVKTQICIPTTHRKKLMTLAHEKFGHLSRNLVVKHQ